MKMNLTNPAVLILCASLLSTSQAFASINLTCVSLDSSKELLIQFNPARPDAIQAQVTDHDTGITKTAKYASNSYSADHDYNFLKGRFTATTIKCNPEIVLRQDRGSFTGYFQATSLAQTSGCLFSGTDLAFHCR